LILATAMSATSGAGCAKHGLRKNSSATAENKDRMISSPSVELLVADYAGTARQRQQLVPTDVAIETSS
jgi:hypothetical protein